MQLTEAETPGMRLQECLMNEVARIAHQPMDRFCHDLKAAQNCKALAFEMLGHTPRPVSTASGCVTRPAPFFHRPVECPCWTISNTHCSWVCRTPDATCSTAAPASPQAPPQGDGEHDRRREDAVQTLILRAESQAELVQVRPARPLSSTACSQCHRPVAISASCCCRRLCCPLPVAMTQRHQALQTTSS